MQCRIYTEPAQIKQIMLLVSMAEKNVTQFTHWGWVTHIYVSKLTSIVSNNGLSPVRRQANMQTNAGYC